MPSKKSKRQVREKNLRGYATTSIPRASANADYYEENEELLPLSTSSSSSCPAAVIFTLSVKGSHVHAMVTPAKQQASPFAAAAADAEVHAAADPLIEPTRQVTEECEAKQRKPMLASPSQPRTIELSMPRTIAATDPADTNHSLSSSPIEPCTLFPPPPPPAPVLSAAASSAPSASTTRKWAVARPPLQSRLPPPPPPLTSAASSSAIFAGLEDEDVQEAEKEEEEAAAEAQGGGFDDDDDDGLLFGMEDDNGVSSGGAAASSSSSSISSSSSAAAAAPPSPSVWSSAPSPSSSSAGAAVSAAIAVPRRGGSADEDGGADEDDDGDDDGSSGLHGSWGVAARRVARSAPVEPSSRIAFPELSPAAPGVEAPHPLLLLPKRAATADEAAERAERLAVEEAAAIAAAADAEEAATSLEGHGEEEEEEGVMCAICHGNIAPNEVALVRGCDHPFCSGCILNWALQKQRCPLCLESFTHVWLYRRVDGTYNDFLHEESVQLLHCAKWFRKQVSGGARLGADDADAADDAYDPQLLDPNGVGGPNGDYHSMLQWMYGGAREEDEENDYYDEMQDGLERGRGRAGGSKAFGQRKWGSGGFVAGGGQRMAARVPNVPSKVARGFSAPFKAKGKGCAGGGSSSSDALCGGNDDGGGGSSGGGSAAPSKAMSKRAEKAALKEAQKEKRRAFVSGAPL